jgi:hypothetical protein
MANLECEAALSDLVLQAARQVIPADSSRLITLPAAGIKNDPLLPLLVALLDSVKVVAAAVADNAWDDCRPLDQELAADLARQARAVAADIESATACPNAASWVPSMTAKELV